jgi:penicillin-binding protein 1A
MMEMSFKKDDIIGFYLNQIFLGHGTYGVESASQFYFQKHVWELNLAECALLASLPSAPNRFSPIRHPHIAMERHKLVLAKMVELGYVTIADAEKAYAEFWPDYLNYINDLPPSYNAWAARHDLAPWFTEHIRRTLIKNIRLKKRHGGGGGGKGKQNQKKKKNIGDKRGFFLKAERRWSTKRGFSSTPRSI